jgi:hypothetical protein
MAHQRANRRTPDSTTVDYSVVCFLLSCRFFYHILSTFVLIRNVLHRFIQKTSTMMCSVRDHTHFVIRQEPDASFIFLPANWSGYKPQWFNHKTLIMMSSVWNVTHYVMCREPQLIYLLVIYPRTSRINWMGRRSSWCPAMSSYAWCDA